LCGGRDHCGQLGQKPMEMPNYAMGGKGTKLVHLNQKVPVELKIPSSCKMVSACDDHSLVLLDNHNVLSFGANNHGQLGREMVSNDIEHFLINPTHFQNSSSEVEKVVFIEAGWHHSAGHYRVGSPLHMGRRETWPTWSWTCQGIKNSLSCEQISQWKIS